MATVGDVKVSVTSGAVRGKSCWIVSYRSGGKRVRKFFPSKAAAKTYASHARGEIHDHGSMWLAVPPEIRGEILDAVSRAQEGGFSLREAVAFFEKHRNQKPRERVFLEHAAGEYLRSREEKGLRARSLQSIRHVLACLLEEVGKIRIDALDAAAIQKAARKAWPNSSTRRTKLVAIKGLFRYAVRRGWLETSPAEHVELPMIEPAPPKILTPEEAAELVTLVRDKHPEALPMVAIMLYAGLRPAEAERIRWEDVRLDRSTIVVEAAASKVRRRRLVTIQPILARILEKVPPDKRTGPIRPANCKRAMTQVRAAWGRPWGQDILRHSFVSYHVAHFADIPKTAIEAGHSVDVLMRHYREVVSPEDAAWFWGSVSTAT